MASGLAAGEWRRIASTTAIVLSVAMLFALGLVAVQALSRILAFLSVALFFAVVLGPAVDFLARRAHVRRGVATVIVFLVAFSALAGLTYAFVKPIVDQGQKFANDLPGYVDDAKEGRGQIGKLVKRYDLDTWVEDNQDKLQSQAGDLGTPALRVVQQIFNGLFAAVTVLVLTFLMLLEAPVLTRGALELVPRAHRERVRRLSSESSRALSGYMAGNLLISLIAGLAAYAYLRLAGVPYAEVLALWVAFCDLIPLVGATLGAVPTIGFAFLHSVPAGIAGIIFFIAYQQFENHVLQTSIMSRTVKVNPLTVLVSVLVGVELFGILGAVFAIPVAGVIQVVARDVWEVRAAVLAREAADGDDGAVAAEIGTVEP